jgi:uncharacterized protein (TIGR02594 family)
MNMNKAYELAKAEIGTVEWKNGDNPTVVAYFADSGNAGVKDDETAWCAAFVGAMLKRAGMRGTGKLNARSYLGWGTPVDRSDAQPGDIVIFKRGNSSWQGHVAFFVKDRGALIDVLGGNQSNAVNVKGYQASQLLGIRRATGAKARPLAKPAAKVPEAIARLGYKTVRDFQAAYGLKVDGIVGPKTTAAMNAASKPTAAKKPVQRVKPAKPSSVAETAKGVSAGAGAVVVTVALWDQISAFFGGIAAKWEAFWVWAFSFLN